MPAYRRAFRPGGTFFLTYVSNFRRPFLTTPLARRLLRAAIVKTQAERPFEVEAVVLLPDHIHWVITLPEGDADFSTRMRVFKGRFTHWYLEAGASDTGRSRSRIRKRERTVWHRRFWEHTIRSRNEFERICNYIHYNPVKHGLVSCPHAWPYSSFEQSVRQKRYDRGWQCVCDGRSPPRIDVDDIGPLAGE